MIIAPKSIIVYLSIIATYFCGKVKTVVYLRPLQCLGGLTGPEFLAFEKCRHIFAAPLWVMFFPLKYMYYLRPFSLFYFKLKFFVFVCVFNMSLQIEKFWGFSFIFLPEMTEISFNFPLKFFIVPCWKVSCWFHHNYFLSKHERKL